MKEQFDLVIGEDGSIEAIYQDGLAQALDAKPVEVKRASHVEWEEGGWTVRSALDPNTAIRLVIQNGAYTKVVGTEGVLCVYQTREDALEDEVKFFWDIVKEKE